MNSIEQLEQRALKAIFTKEQRSYFDKLIARAKEVANGRTRQQMAEARDVAGLREIKKLQQALIVFLQTKEVPGTGEITVTDNDGKEYRFDMNEQLESSRAFFEKHGIDWAKLPDKIDLSDEQKKEALRIIEALCPEGDYDKIKIMVMPEGLTDTGAKYESLHAKLTAGSGYGESYQSDNFMEDGGFGAMQNKDNKATILITREAQETRDDKLFSKTLQARVDKKVEADGSVKYGYLEGEGGIFEETGLRGLSPADLLVLERDFFDRTKKHLDVNGSTWLPEVNRSGSGRVSRSRWRLGYYQLGFSSSTPDGGDFSIGCRLAGRLSL